KVLVAEECPIDGCNVVHFTLFHCGAENTLGQVLSLWIVPEKRAGSARSSIFAPMPRSLFCQNASTPADLSSNLTRSHSSRRNANAPSQRLSPVYNHSSPLRRSR